MQNKIKKKRPRQRAVRGNERHCKAWIQRRFLETDRPSFQQQLYSTTVCTTLFTCTFQH